MSITSTTSAVLDWPLEASTAVGLRSESMAADPITAGTQCPITWDNDRQHLVKGNYSHACKHDLGHGGSHQCECGDTK